MGGIFRDDAAIDLLLPGKPADYLNTSILDEANLALLSEREVMLQVLEDPTPLPTTAAREGYFGDRHLEYWLSGLREMRKVLAATGLDRVEQPRVLDFGGASGRVIRHFRGWRRNAELYLSDINAEHVLLAKQMFGGRVTSLHNHVQPVLPFPDDYLDCVVAFSVFTHIDADDTAWLLELRRIVKPGGYLYITVHDQDTWTILPRTVIADLCFSSEEFRHYHATHPELRGRKVHTVTDAEAYNCNVFVGPDYIEHFWAPLFKGWEMAALAHDHQSAVILTV